MKQITIYDSSGKCCPFNLAPFNKEEERVNMNQQLVGEGKRFWH